MKTLSLILLFVIVAACSSSVDLQKIDHPRYRYIYDFESRVAQHELRNQRANTKAVNMILYDAFNPKSPRNLDCPPDMSYEECNNIPQIEDFKKIKVVNDTHRMLFIDVVSDAANTKTTIRNIRNVKLPPGEEIQLVVAAEEPYQLAYGFSENQKLNITKFTPGFSRRKFIIRESGIKGIN